MLLRICYNFLVYIYPIDKFYIGRHESSKNRTRFPFDIDYYDEDSYSLKYRVACKRDTSEGKTDRKKIIESSHETTNSPGFRLGLTLTSLCSQRGRIEVWNVRFRKKRHCITCIYGSKTNALISCAVPAQLIYVFVFAYPDCCFFFLVRWLNYSRSNKKESC